jgi:hypothetical protein
MRTDYFLWNRCTVTVRRSFFSAVAKALQTYARSLTARGQTEADCLMLCRRSIRLG